MYHLDSRTGRTRKRKKASHGRGYISMLKNYEAYKRDVNAPSPPRGDLWGAEGPGRVKEHKRWKLWAAKRTYHSGNENASGWVWSGKALVSNRRKVGLLLAPKVCERELSHSWSQEDLLTRQIVSWRAVFGSKSTRSVWRETLYVQTMTFQELCSDCWLLSARIFQRFITKCAASNQLSCSSFSNSWISAGFHDG